MGPAAASRASRISKREADRETAQVDERPVINTAWEPGNEFAHFLEKGSARRRKWKQMSHGLARMTRIRQGVASISVSFAFIRGQILAWLHNLHKACSVVASLRHGSKTSYDRFMVAVVLCICICDVVRVISAF